MHNTFRTVFFVCAAAAGAGLVCAQEVAEGGIDLLHGASQGPRGESKSNFEALLQKPNATGTFRLPRPVAYVPSAVDSSGMSADDWFWSITVVADLPVPSPPQDKDKFYTGGELVFNVPSTATNTYSTSNDTIEDKLSVCLYTWALWDVAYPDALRQDNGTCLSVLSPECIKAIEWSAVLEHSTGSCSLPRASELPECAALGGDKTLWSNSGGTSWYNASALRAWGDAGGVRSTIFGDIHPHERGNITAYNYVGSLAWPVMASFRGFKGDALTTAKMSCPRADTATEGSIAPTDDGLGAGNGQGQDAGHGESDQEDGGDRVGANWLVLGSLLVVAMLIA